MNNSQVITRWLETHRRLTAEAEASRDSQAVAFGILSEFDLLGVDDREDVFPLLAEWLLSDDRCLRYDAAFIISQRKVREMFPALHVALAKCERTAGPEARHDAENLRRIIDELADAH
jgi:hypothetical protein